MFAHLHVHTEYSLLDGACRVEELVRRASELGQTSLAITDHGVMYGCVNFYNTCIKYGIKPIIGCEVYVAVRGLEQKSHGIDNDRNHLVLLCKNEIGYRNLISMVSKSWTEGFYTKPRVDKELLKKHSEGLIALSGCLAGEVNRAILRGDYQNAKDVALWFKGVFGSDYYLEMQNHGYSEQLSVNPALKRLSAELDIPLVATNDVHYTNKEDHEIQEILLCIGTNHVVGENTGMSFRTREFFLKSEKEMLEAFSDYPEAVSNTGEIVDKCDFDFRFGNIVLPHFDVPNNMDHSVYFRNQCFYGLDMLFESDPPQEYVDRLEYELDVINKMGYVDYFLIVADFIAFAKRNDIPVGPGRGSGAGSLAAYCMGITGIDPIRYNLLFERFLNPERVSMPDFDIDFCFVRRQEVIDYVCRKYGNDHVAQIVTFGTLAARAAIRDVGRALGMSYPLVDSIAKMIPNTLHITLDSALKESPELINIYRSNNDAHRLIDISKKVEGMLRHASTHAAGVVITREPVSYYVPLALNDSNAVTQYTMTELESLGLLKMDFLGLRNLTTIHDAVVMIRKIKPSFDIDKIPLDDPLTFKLLSEGKTEAVFQLESDGMKRTLMRLKPRSIEDLTAIISLYRPGPADSIDTYIRNKNNPERTEYKTEKLRDILGVTYGCMVYQEQVMEICREIAGYSYGRADLVRRAMAKKKQDVMDKERRNFIYGLKNDDGSVNCAGAVANGIDERTANEIFDEMSGFAKYAFNKSHACAYAHISYQTAYLKTHFPCQFMASTMSSVLDSGRKIAAYISEASKMGIKTLPPSVNESGNGFTVRGDSIIFGLEAVKNVGKGLIRKIVDERELNGKYKSFSDFMKRLYGREFNRRAAESLIKVGACDCLDENRNRMLLLLPQIFDALDSEGSRNIAGQIGFFDAGSELSSDDEFSSDTDIEDFTLTEKLSFEKELAGFYFSGHPMAEYEYIYRIIHASEITGLLSGDRHLDGKTVRLFGMIASVDVRKTKKGDRMCILRLEDLSGDIECLAFSSVFEKKREMFSVGKIVVVDGRVSEKENEDPSVICFDISPNPDQLYPKEKYKRKTGVFIRINRANSLNAEKAKALCRLFPGSSDVYFFDEKTESSKKIGRIDYSDPVKAYLISAFGKENIVFRKD